MAAKITKLNDDTFMLTDMLIRVNQFLLRGEKSALLLDTGYGGEKFLKAVKKLAALPVIAANTHLHPDHSGGNDLFERVYVARRTCRKMVCLPTIWRAAWRNITANTRIFPRRS